MNGLEPSSGQWLAAILRLRAALENPIEEEEQQIWPKIHEAWERARLEQAGQDLETEKQRTGRAA